MWDALQQQSFLVGAALILIYQAARFGEIYAGDPVTSRYVSLLPGTGVRDFAGPHAYHWALAAFLVASLVVYSALCLISPNVLTGAVKLLTNNADADQISEGVPLPLYIAALFMGLTQPIIPGLSQFQTAQLNFFHDRIEVPRRIIDISESLTVAIEARAGEDRQQLVAEVRKLVGNDFLASLQPHGDLAFYKLQLEKMEVDNGSLEATNQGQLREGAPRLDRTAGALRAGCGVAQVRAEAAHQGGPEARNSVVRYQARRPPGIAGLIASGVLFFAGLFIIAELLLQLAGPVDALFGKSITEGLWPSTLDYSFQELWSIALPIGVCMFIAVCKLAPRGEARQSDPEPELDADASPFDDFLDFIRSNAAVLLLCIFTTIAIKIGLMFWEYGTVNHPKRGRRCG